MKVCLSACTRVGDHDEGAVWAVLDDLGDDGLEDIHIPLHQIEAALAFLLANASRHHDQTRVGCHCVVWRIRREWKRGTQRRVLNIYYFMKWSVNSSLISDILYSVVICEQGCPNLYQQLFWRSWGRGYRAADPWPLLSDDLPSHQPEPAHQLGPAQMKWCRGWIDGENGSERRKK